MRMRMLLVLCAAIVLSVGVATATAGGGNSAAAKACQKGGWQNWVRADHTAFRNEDDCVSYAAQGGTLTSPKTQSQLDCESLGGTFSGGIALWQCGPLPFDFTILNILTNDCNAELLAHQPPAHPVAAIPYSTTTQLYSCSII